MASGIDQKWFSDLFTLTEACDRCQKLPCILKTGDSGKASVVSVGEHILVEKLVRVEFVKAKIVKYDDRMEAIRQFGDEKVKQREKLVGTVRLLPVGYSGNIAKMEGSYENIKSGVTLQEALQQGKLPQTMSFGEVNKKDLLASDQKEIDILTSLLAGPVELQSRQSSQMFVCYIRAHGADDKDSTISMVLVPKKTTMGLFVHLPRNEAGLLKAFFPEYSATVKWFDRLYSIPPDSLDKVIFLRSSLAPAEPETANPELPRRRGKPESQRIVKSSISLEERKPLVPKSTPLQDKSKRETMQTTGETKFKRSQSVPEEQRTSESKKPNSKSEPLSKPQPLKGDTSPSYVKMFPPDNDDDDIRKRPDYQNLEGIQMLKKLKPVGSSGPKGSPVAKMPKPPADDNGMDGYEIPVTSNTAKSNTVIGRALPAVPVSTTTQEEEMYDTIDDNKMYDLLNHKNDEKPYASLTSSRNSKRVSISSEAALENLFTSQKAKKFFRKTVAKLATCLEACGLADMAKVCQKEKTDGKILQKLSEEDLTNEPYSLNSYQLKKLKLMIDGWRPNTK